MTDVMQVAEAQYARGLEGVIATESAICKIDGQNGKLYYRGYSIEHLTTHHTFEEVTYLLLQGSLPDPEQLKKFSAQLRAERAVPGIIVDTLRRYPRSVHPMEVLQSIIPYIGALRREEGRAIDISCENSYHLVAQFATIVAYIYRIRLELPIIEPDNSLSHGANFLYMLNAQKPTDLAGTAMDVAFTLHAEHSLNASTFTARVVASTLASCYTSVSAAIGALYGPLHGGANEQVLEMVQNIADPEKAAEWVNNALTNKEKIMGMGHRVYKAMDPRAVVIERLLQQLSKSLPHHNDYPILKVVQETVRNYMEKRNKPIYPNVDFFSGAIYNMLSIPSDLFTPIFAAARIAGWIAHIAEQYSNNRIYRPRALYVGPDPRS